MKIPLIVLFTCLLALSLRAAAPVVSNVQAMQRPGTKLVDIHYDVHDSDSTNLSIYVLVSVDGTNFTISATALSGVNSFGSSVTPGVNKHIIWNAGMDWNHQFTSRAKVRVVANDGTPAPVPSGMSLIPASYFNMGDSLDGIADALPVHSVFVTAFYMDKYEVTKALWDEVKNWNGGNGYSYDNAGTGKATNHPVQTVSWFDVVKFCNARSQKEGLTPVYYTDAGLTTVYKTGQVAPYPNWSANGYRLPTEAEWEKAARGGAAGHRFPWTDADTISHSRANYNANSGEAYDLSNGVGHHPTYATNGMPYTSPVGSFAANGYGLYDMAGNVWEWCWDWYGSSYYSSSPGTDPRGPTSGSIRGVRGGSWYSGAGSTRCAGRFINLTSSLGYYNVGFRCVRGL